MSACYNGSISAVRTSWADTVSTFAYSYDPQNRLLSSNRVTHSSQALSERFTYDPEGNILSLKRFSGSRKIDDLTYSYGSDGNRLLAVTDNGQDADLYSTIEYHHSEAQADTTMFYDANGNLIRDLDRGITAIQYNILNLPRYHSVYQWQLVRVREDRPRGRNSSYKTSNRVLLKDQYTLVRTNLHPLWQ